MFAYFIVHYLPTGLLGLVIAAIFSAAMSTLSGSLNASASSTVNDLYRPLFPADRRASPAPALARADGRLGRRPDGRGARRDAARRRAWSTTR